MRKNLKPSWDKVQALLPEVDHPWINALNNSDGKKVEIAVGLMNKGEPALKATVHFYNCPYFLYQPALVVLLNRLERHNLTVEWDQAWFLSQAGKHWDRADLKMDDPFTNLVRIAANMKMDDVVSMIKDVWKELQPFATKEMKDQYYQDIGSAILGSTATVTSADMERMIYDRNWHMPFTGFKAKGLEF